MKYYVLTGVVILSLITSCRKEEGKTTPDPPSPTVKTLADYLSEVAGTYTMTGRYQSTSTSGHVDTIVTEHWVISGTGDSTIAADGSDLPEFRFARHDTAEQRIAFEHVPPVYGTEYMHYYYDADSIDYYAKFSTTALRFEKSLQSE